MTRRLLKCTLPPALLYAAVRLFPTFAERWSACVARPILHLLSSVGGRLPFSLLEWGVPVLLLALCLGFVLRMRRGWMHAAAVTLRRLLSLMLALIHLTAALWLPLCFAQVSPQVSVGAAQLAASCRSLMDALFDLPDFSMPPDDLPAKQCAFPFWMEALNLSGFASFLTGEALISPELPDAAVPFVAVHEAMHLRGIADEGQANLAAWEECLRRGGVYAASARLWALKDSLSLLRGMDDAAWSSIRSELPPQLDLLLSRLGGGTAPPGRAVLAVLRLLGLAQQAQSYNILALRLAADMPV